MSDDEKPQGEGPPGGRRAGRCPICRQPTVERFRPFCSKRCADVDLGRWLGERYRVPGEPALDEPVADED